MSIINLINRHESQLTKTINLVASENLLSSDVKKALSSDLSMRYCIPPENERPPNIWDYPNQEHIRKICSETESLAMKLLNAEYADCRPLSGNQIAQIILMSTVSKGDTVWSIPSDCGGHFATPVIANKFGLNLVAIPYDYSRGIIDVDAAQEMAKRQHPKLIFLDASMQLFPHPLRKLREAVGPETIISYDASHTLGLISGKSFQDPLNEGADLLHGSTHKTFWGPQKGIITAREKSHLSNTLNDALVPFFVSNVHVHHVAALGVAFEESRDYGEKYATAVILNAKALASSLNLHGVNVLFQKYGATESHQVLVDLGDKASTMTLWNRLQACGINTNAIKLPFTESYGLRIGVAEATRRGLGVNEMQTLGLCIANSVFNLWSPEKISEVVCHMSGQYNKILYTSNPTIV